MKKFTLLIFLMFCAFGFSQNSPITFESGGYGSSWTFSSFENSTGIGYEKAANPFVTGINTSATVGKYTAVVAGQPWAGCETAHASGANGIGAFTFSLSNCIVKVMVYKSVISDVGLKFAEANGEAQPEVKVANTKINEWEELTFDMSGSIGKGATGIIDQMIIFPDFQARSTENVCYFDNITFSAKTTTIPPGTGPTAAAQAPPARSAVDVKSVFSNAYSDIAGTSWTPNWGQSTISEEVSVSGDAVKKLLNLNYQGVVPAAAIDASAMTKLHLDVWTADCTALDVYLINPGPTEQKVTLTPTLSGWNSFDINLSDYTNIALNNVFQFKFVSPNQNSTVYLDNMYFYKSGSVTPPTPTGPNVPVTFETGEQGSTWTFTNFENGTDLSIGYEKVANPSATGLNTSATVGKFTATVAGATWAGCQSDGIGKFTLDPTNSTVKIMVYKTVISDVALKFAVAGGGSLGEIKVPNTKVNEWEELTFDFYNQIGKLESTDIVTMMVSPDYRVRTTDNISYFDNITFSKTSVASPVLVCDAVLTEAQQGTFDIGYKTSFVTTGTDVLVTFELLDAKDGTVAYLWKESPFGETAMTNVPGTKKFTYNLTGQTAGNIITYACKFGYAGGQAVTKYIKYEVGSTCSGVTPPPVVTGPTLPLDFESGTFAFVDFDGGAVTTIANPDKTGINTTATVAKMVKGAGAQWAGSKLKMAAPIDFSTKKIFKVKVWSPVAGKKLLLKFEGAGAAFEKEVATTVANTWEELTFDYTGVAGVNDLNDNMVFIFDLGTAGDGSVNSTYYFDEITQPGTTPPVVTGPTLPLDFESGTFAFVDFDGGAVTTIANPDKTGINTTATVAKMVKGAGAQWAGSKLKMASPVDFSTKKMIKVKVWSPVAGKKLLLKFEGAGAAFEKEVATTVANTWEELTFDYTGVAGVNDLNDNMVFIFDLGTAGDGSVNSTYYFDEITQPGTTPPVVTGPTLPLDFESGTFAFVDFDGGAVTTIANPDKTGINTTATVAKMVKGTGQPWGGSKLTLATPVDFSTKKIFKVKVWSPVAGKKLLLKFESPNGNFEKESVGVTTANTWEELTFDFTNVSTTNTASDMVFIFDLGTAGDGSANSTYLFDEITQSTGSVPVTGTTLPLDFEAATYSFVDFDGAVATKIANPQMNGINTSSNVAQMVKGAGQPWAGSKIKLATPVDFSTNKLFKVKVWSPVAGKKLLLKFEGTAGNCEQESTGVTAANTWEELTFDFSKVGTNNVADFMVFIFDIGTMGDGSANSTYLFDDVKQTSIPVAPSTNYLVSFETGSVIGTWNSFENPGQTGFEFASNPSKTGINTSDNVGKFTAVPTGQRWAGCETAGGSIGTWELDATSTTVTMMVYKSVISPVGIKMATSYNGTTFEIKKSNTKINEWELMTFDISPFITSGDATMINKFVVFPDFRSDTDPVRNSDVVVYFDDIKFSAKKIYDPNYVAPPVENPTVAAPVPPTRTAADVKSVFSDAYAVYKAGNWCQCWGQSTVVSDVTIAGDLTRKLENFTYQGITLADGEVFDVSDMNKVHIDLWFNDAEEVSLALVQQTPDGSKEAALKFTPSKTGWNSFDLDLNSTTVPGIDLSKVFQMKLNSKKQGSNVFLDNFYFWKDATTVLAQMDLPVTFDDATVDYALVGFGGADVSTIVVDPTLASNKVAKVVKSAIAETWAGTTISAAAGLGFSNPIPFSASLTKMSVRVWSPEAGTIIRLKVEEHGDNTHTVETEAAVTTASGWETLEFDFAKPVSGTAALNLAYQYDKATIFFGFGTTGTEKIYYFDDVKMTEVAVEPILSYGVSSQSYLVGQAIYPLTINNSGGLVPANGYSINPTLPAGLTFDTTTAVISGTPSALSQPTTYTVMGTNSSGSASTTISIDVVRELKSNNFTIKTIGETCLGENNGEIRITASETNVYVAVVNNKSYEFTTNSLRVLNLTPGTYTISISVKGETTSQSFIVVIPKGSTTTGKTSKHSYNKFTVVMTEGTAPYKVYLDGVEQFETPFSTFTVDVNKDSLLEVVSAKNCEGTYTKNIDGLLDASAVFPNPTSGSFEIAIPSNRKEVVIDLYSLNSMFISSKSYPLENGTVKLSLEGQRDGIYIAKVYLDTPSYLKIIKK